jgi:hypothetical protein
MADKYRCNDAAMPQHQYSSAARNASLSEFGAVATPLATDEDDEEEEEDDPFALPADEVELDDDEWKAVEGPDPDGVVFDVGVPGVEEEGRLVYEVAMCKVSRRQFSRSDFNTSAPSRCMMDTRTPSMSNERTEWCFFFEFL